MAGAWHTPPEYIAAAREVMDGIDLIPTSDHLEAAWHGRVWMQPPQTRGGNLPFARKLIAEYTAGRATAAIALTNNGTETQWGQLLIGHAAAGCFHLGRIRFLDDANMPTRAPIQGQMFTYFGPHPERFRAVFERYGFIWVPRMTHLSGDRTRQPTPPTSTS